MALEPVSLQGHSIENGQPRTTHQENQCLWAYGAMLELPLRSLGMGAFGRFPRRPRTCLFSEIWNLVELVGTEKLGILKTDKLLICRESYNAHKASNVCNAGFIARLLYGDSQSKQLRFHNKVRSQRPRGNRLERDFAQGTRRSSTGRSARGSAPGGDPRSLVRAENDPAACLPVPGTLPLPHGVVPEISTAASQADLTNLHIMYREAPERIAS
jgi:hypothetical protein